MFWKSLLNKRSCPITSNEKYCGSNPAFFVALAPMEDVSDAAFREFLAQTPNCKPDVFFTEFMNINGLCRSNSPKMLMRFKYTSAQKPIVAQIWGTDPALFYEAAKIVKSYEFDAIDINIACPHDKVLKCGGGGALIGNNSQVSEIIDATVRGGMGLEVSVKTRLGIKDYLTDSWVPFLLSQPISALTVHGRTVAQLSKADANWDEIKKVVEYRNSINKDILIIGNGDVTSMAQAALKVAESGVDGVMIGRGAIKNPFIFSLASIQDKSVSERAQAYKQHVLYFKELMMPYFSSEYVKKFARIYFSQANILNMINKTNDIESLINLLSNLSE